MESGYDVTRVRIPFPAEYQVMNGTLALAAANRLKARLPITEEGIAEGFWNVAWPGRMEEIYPEVYLDGAHNVSGIQAFLKAVNNIADTPSILLFSMVKEKDYREAIRMLCEEGNWEEIVLTEISENSRALELGSLQECFNEEISSNRNIKILAVKEPREALKKAMADRKPGQKLFCAGSLYLVGELKMAVQGL